MLIYVHILRINNHPQKLAQLIHVPLFTENIFSQPREVSGNSYPYPFKKNMNDYPIFSDKILHMLIINLLSKNVYYFSFDSK